MLLIYCVFFHCFCCNIGYCSLFEFLSWIFNGQNCCGFFFTLIVKILYAKIYLHMYVCM